MLELPYLLDERYQLEHIAGSGGFGTVYKATDLRLQRQVAVKIIHPHLATKKNQQRFIQEAQIASQLNHTHLLTIYDFRVMQSGITYLVSQYLTGTSLQEYLNHVSLNIVETLTIIRQVALALECAHQSGIIHRDIKPSNIFLGFDQTRVHATLIDFGIAKTMLSPKITQTQNPLGTPQYMSPEQIQSQPLQPSSDLYSLGIVLFECLHGRPPFESSDSFQLLLSQVQESVPIYPLPHPLTSTIEKSIQDLIQALTQKDPNQRLSNAHQVHQWLTTLLEELKYSPEVKPTLRPYIFNQNPNQNQTEDLDDLLDSTLVDGDLEDEDLLDGDDQTDLTDTSDQIHHSPSPSLTENHLHTQKSSPLLPQQSYKEESKSTPSFQPHQSTSKPINSNLHPVSHSQSQPLQNQPQLQDDPLDQMLRPHILSSNHQSNTLPKEPNLDTLSTQLRLWPNSLKNQSILGLILIGVIALTWYLIPTPPVSIPTSSPPSQIEAFAPSLSQYSVKKESLKTKKYSGKKRASKKGKISSKDTRSSSSHTSQNRSKKLCPKGMVLQKLKINPQFTKKYCIDRYEYSGKGNLPKVNISFTGAESLCKQMGKRLCSYKEWTESCRKGSALYPYGSTFRANRCNTEDKDGREGQIRRSGSFKKCKNPQGVYDLSGNVSEWVSDQRAYGGYYASSGEDANCVNGHFYKRSSIRPYIGFRCCTSLSYNP